MGEDVVYLASVRPVRGLGVAQYNCIPNGKGQGNGQLVKKKDFCTPPPRLDMAGQRQMYTKAYERNLKYAFGITRD